MKASQQNPENSNKEVTASGKERWSSPVIVPLDVTLSEGNPGVGFDGSVPFPDSTLS